MKNLKNNSFDKHSNNNRKTHYKAISLASLSTLAMTMVLSDIGEAHAMMPGSSFVRSLGATANRFYGSAGSRPLGGTYTGTALKPTLSGPPKVTTDIAGRTPPSSRPSTPIPRPNLNTNLTGGGKLPQNIASNKKPITIQGGIGGGTTNITNNKPSIIPQNKPTLGGSGSAFKPVGGSTQQKPSINNNNSKPTINNNKNQIGVGPSKGDRFFVDRNGDKINFKLSSDGKGLIYYKKNSDGTITNLKQNFNKDGQEFFTPTQDNKPLVSTGVKDLFDGLLPNTSGGAGGLKPIDINANKGQQQKPSVGAGSNTAQQQGGSTGGLKPIDTNSNKGQQKPSASAGSNTTQQQSGGAGGLKPIDSNSNKGQQQKPSAGAEKNDGNNTTVPVVIPTGGAGGKKPNSSQNTNIGSNNTTNKPNTSDKDGTGDSNQLRPIKTPNSTTNSSTNITNTTNNNKKKKLTKKQKAGLIGGGAALGVLGLGLGLGLGLNNNGQGGHGGGNGAGGNGTPPTLVPVPDRPNFIGGVNSAQGNNYIDE